MSRDEGADSRAALPGPARGGQAAADPAADRRATARAGHAAPSSDAQTALADAFARLYDVDLLDDPGDLDLYLALAARTGGPILELAVGSGRIAVPIAVAGHDVTGVDLDPAMLRRADARARLEGPEVAGRVHLVDGDARTIRLPRAGRFRLAFIALNSLLIMGDRDDQLAVLETMAAHLAPDGLAIVDVWLPDADALARYDGRLGLEYIRTDPETAGTVLKLASARHDATTSTIELSLIYDEGPPGVPPVRWVREDTLRLVGAAELRAIAQGAGLRVEVIAGAYDLEPLQPGDDRAILVARAPGPEATAGRGRAVRPGRTTAGQIGTEALQERPRRLV